MSDVDDIACQFRISPAQPVGIAAGLLGVEIIAFF